jgi:hypothetical protein
LLGENEEFLKTGQFTQMIWKGTREIGIGYAWNEDKYQNFVVAVFRPKGNNMGEYSANVLPIYDGERTTLFCFPNLAKI